MKKKIKEAEAWKPKSRWIDSFTVNLKTGKARYRYFVPKTAEEEERLKADSNKQMAELFDILLSEHFSKKQKSDII